MTDANPSRSTRIFGAVVFLLAAAIGVVVGFLDAPRWIIPSVLVLGLVISVALMVRRSREPHTGS